MPGHAIYQDTTDEQLVLGNRSRQVYTVAVLAAVVGLGISLLLSLVSEAGLRRFFFGYLVAFAFFLSISLGALFTVLMQFLTRAGWSVGVRRIAEGLTGLLPALAILSVPIVATVVLQHGTLYRWALPATDAQIQHAKQVTEPEELPEHPENGTDQQAKVDSLRTPQLDVTTLKKRGWLNPWFFVLRVIIYFAVWCSIAGFYRRQSLRQDDTGDPEITRELQAWAGICVVGLILTLSGAAVDFLMSLDPHWFSTMWGFYYFVGAVLSSWATLIIVVYLLQRAGYLTRTITIEHYHDLGKYMFGFTFAWGYIAFSQYMLLWYANIPEEVQWFSRHGATTVSSNINRWTWVILALLFGQLLIPFAGLLSRHVKRRVGVLVFWAVWVLTFHFIDVYWMVMPELKEFGLRYQVWTVLLDVAVLVGVGGVMVATLLRVMSPHSLRPVADPRLPETLAFHNV